jgi:oligopeptide/dipeptide ABC transporter ATP-binding protein
VFISHDLSVIRQVSDRIAVMYLGRVVEIGPSETLYQHPRHPYTAALLSAVPRPETNGGGMGRKQRIVLGGDVPSPVDPPAACVFHPRCPRFQAGHCDVETPLLRVFEPSHEAACHYPVERWPMTEDELRRPFGGRAVSSDPLASS